MKLEKGGVPKLTSSIKLKVDWDDIRVFNAVADAGAMAGAARVLGITPGSVSKRIEDLEKRLGATLFHRNATGVSLTEAGLIVRDHGLTMERSADAIGRLVGARDKKHEGRVTLEAPDGIAAYWLAPRLAAFHRDNPKIRLAIDCGMWHANPLPDPPEIAITTKAEKRPDYVAIPLATLHYALFASPAYLESNGAPPTFASIAEHRFLNFTPISEQEENWHPRAGALRGMVDFSLETNSSAMLFQALLSGAGIAVAPTAVKSFAPDLVMVYPEPMSKIQLWLVHHRDAPDAARIRAVAEWVKQIFDHRLCPWFRTEFVHPDAFAEMLAPKPKAPPRARR